jgi:hypothetical protein
MGSELFLIQRLADEVKFHTSLPRGSAVEIMKRLETPGSVPPARRTAASEPMPLASPTAASEPGRARTRVRRKSPAARAPRSATGAQGST